MASIKKSLYETAFSANRILTGQAITDVIKKPVELRQDYYDQSTGNNGTSFTGVEKTHEKSEYKKKKINHNIQSL
jgi:hypothetical protein